MIKILYIINRGGDPYRDRRMVTEFRKFPDVEIIVCEGAKIITANRLPINHLNADATITMYGRQTLGNIIKRYPIKAFNKIDASFTANNKWATYKKLKEANIPQPKTSLNPNFDFPYICKAKFGSMGNDIKLITSADDSEPVKVSHIFQEYIAESAGRSTRVIMVDKKPVAWYSLVNEKSFKSNFAKGGVGYKCELTPEMEDLCIRTAKCLDLDYCGIDLLHSNRGWLILEVNSKAGLKGIESFTGQNVAKHFAKYVVETLRESKGQSKKEN